LSELRPFSRVVDQLVIVDRLVGSDHSSRYGCILTLWFWRN